MKAIRIHQFGDAGTLKLEDIPALAISDDQMLILVHDAGVNPIDWKIRQGYVKQSTPNPFPLTIGQDFAGEVTDLGTAIQHFRKGDRVFGFAHGAYAEYVAAPESTVATIPASMDYATAAALPTAGLTALQAIRDFIHAAPGMTILIHGAAGGVGSFAIQIAKAFGANVIGTATGDDVGYLNSLGVTDVIDYTRERFEDKARNVDGVLDLVGGDTLTRSYAVIKKGGLLVTTVGQIDEARAKQAGIHAAHIAMNKNAADLVELASMVANGSVKPRMAQSMPLSDAKKAQELSQNGGLHGKVILKVA
ncbi:MAG TPA: NADP-dependent oxidoreductase [Terriglobales bacterium]